MSTADLPAKIRELVASGVLPKDSPPITRPEPWSTLGNKRSKVLVGGPLHKPCTICGEPGPHVERQILRHEPPGPTAFSVA